MADTLGDMQATVAGAASSLVARLKTIATELAAIEPTDSIEYKTDLLAEMKQITELLKEWGVEPADILSPSVADTPYEQFVQGII